MVVALLLPVAPCRPLVGLFNRDVGNLLRDDEGVTPVDLGVLLLEGAVLGRVGVVEGGFNWDPGALEVDLAPGL